MATAKTSFLLCVYGEFRFGTSLAESVRGITVGEKRVEVRWIHKLPEVRSCQILFVGQSEQTRYASILDTARGAGVLTVGETPDFLHAGGMVSFSSRGETIEFDVNLNEASQEHLKISSQMLALARRVVNQTQAAKS